MDIIVGRSVKYTGVVLNTVSGFATKFSSTSTRCLYHCDTRRWSAGGYDANPRWPIATVSRCLAASYSVGLRINIHDRFIKSPINCLGFSTSHPQPPTKDSQEPAVPEKQTIFQKMKQLTKDYWHILIPVHLVTSAGWVSIFYIAAKNGVDVVHILESLNLSNRYLDILRGSNAGHWAVTYALYKLFTPIRYTVTVGGTTMAIRYLDRFGYLKFKPRSTIKTVRKMLPRERNPKNAQRNTGEDTLRQGSRISSKLNRQKLNTRA